MGKLLGVPKEKQRIMSIIAQRGHFFVHMAKYRHKKSWEALRWLEKEGRVIEDHSRRDGMWRYFVARPTEAESDGD